MFSRGILVCHLRKEEKPLDAFWEENFWHSIQDQIFQECIFHDYLPIILEYVRYGAGL